MIKEVDARTVLKAERIDYWIGVGAQPTEKVKVLIKKYGTNGTHLEQQKAAVERMKALKPMAPPPMVVPKPKKEEPAPADEPAASEAEASDQAQSSEGGESSDE